jgi:hypothetical protein
MEKPKLSFFVALKKTCKSSLLKCSIFVLTPKTDRNTENRCRLLLKTIKTPKKLFSVCGVVEARAKHGVRAAVKGHALTWGEVQ